MPAILEMITPKECWYCVCRRHVSVMVNQDEYHCQALADKIHLFNSDTIIEQNGRRRWNCPLKIIP